MKKYYLMHKDDICGAIVFDDDAGKINAYKDALTGHSPFLGTADSSKIKKWWEMRAVPASRTMIQNLIKKAECINSETYLEKNLALSMTDRYWVRPIDSNLCYDDISFPNLASYNEGKIPYHNESSYDPNASLGGQMEKYWDMEGPVPMLVKESYKYYGQQSINEAFATILHEKQGSGVPFVHYSIGKTEDGGTYCRCPAFTTENIELIPAYEVIESVKQRNDVSLYDTYISTCIQLGIEERVIQNFMDYQTLTDFIISNTDEHLLNFALLRNSDTMEIIGPAPIFDSGNSMFFAEGINCKMDRVGLLDRQITAFYKTEEKMIAKVKDTSIVKVENLPSKEFVIEFYTNGGLPEEKADSIAHNYLLKIEFVKELQRGMTISLHNEKRNLGKKEKESQKETILEKFEKTKQNGNGITEAKNKIRKAAKSEESKEIKSSIERSK